MKIVVKIQKAKDLIQGYDLKKAGKNEFAKYAYYTPEQVDILVNKACKEAGLFNKYDLKHSENGLEATITVIDTESFESIIYTAATAMANIKGTNDTQQLGGTMTYSERYLLMTIYGIKDNNLDPDTGEPQAKKPESKQPEKKWLNKWSDKAKTTISPEYTKIIQGAKAKGSTLQDLMGYFNISKEIQAEVTNDLK